MKIGCIGLGGMGRPMAEHLLAAGQVASAVLQQLDALMAAGWGRDDTSRLLCVLERV